MTLHFAYGANMSRAIMKRHARDAEPLGVAELTGHRFVITGDGYASVEPARAETVHGVVWRITPRDRVTLDAWENVAAGLYRAETVPVRHGGELMPAVVYFASRAGKGARSPAISSWCWPPRVNGGCRLLMFARSKAGRCSTRSAAATASWETSCDSCPACGVSRSRAGGGLPRLRAGGGRAARS